MADVGSVGELWRFPVKSMLGERLDRIDIMERGVLGDRAYALIDEETGKVVSAKSARLFPDLLACRAAFLDVPQPGRGLPPVRITLPDGTAVVSDAPDANERLSAWFGRVVRLARAAPADFTVDQYHPDIEGLDPAGHRDRVVEQKLGSALFAAAGLASPVPEGSFLDVFPFSVVTTSTLERLRTLAPRSRIDSRRFRMNVVIATTESGFLENEWVGRELAIGPAARLTVALPDPRCVMTTLAQEDLPADSGILRTLVQHNTIPVGNIGRYPCAGVYAVLGNGGSVQVGDPVLLI